MANIDIQCPHCEQPLQIPDELIGQAVQCPSCNSEIDVNAQGKPEANNISCINCAASLQADSVICTHCGTNQQTGKTMQTDTESDSVLSNMIPAEPKQSETTAIVKVNIILGIIGGLAAGLAGMLVWYYIIKVTGYEIGYLAWGIGVLVGVATLKLAGAESLTTGIAAAVIAAVAIVGGQVLALNAGIDKHIATEAAGLYASELAFANQVCAAKDKASIRSAIAIMNSQNYEKADEKTVTKEQIASFETEIRPKFQDFVNGKPSREETIELYSSIIKDSIPFSAVVKNSVGIFTALWLFLGVGTAFKIASGTGNKD